MFLIPWTIDKNKGSSSSSAELTSFVDEWEYCHSQSLGFLQSRLKGVPVIIMDLLTVELKSGFLSSQVFVILIFSVLRGLLRWYTGNLSFIGAGGRSLSCF